MNINLNKSVFNSDGRILIHPIDKAEKLNTFFASISHIDIDPNFPELGPGPPEDNFLNFEIMKSRCP